MKRSLILVLLLLTGCGAWQFIRYGDRGGPATVTWRPDTVRDDESVRDWIDNMCGDVWCESDFDPRFTFVGGDGKGNVWVDWTLTAKDPELRAWMDVTCYDSRGISVRVTGGPTNWVVRSMLRDVTFTPGRWEPFGENHDPYTALCKAIDEASAAVQSEATRESEFRRPEHSQ